MKFGDKIYTYKDIEEAKKLIGKKVVYSDCLQVIEQIQYNDFSFVGTLVQVNSEHTLPFAISGNFGLMDYQFIREVIDDEPSYRPFKDVDELIDHYVNTYDIDVPKCGMPLIWIKPKNSDSSLKEAILITEVWSDGVCTTYSKDTITFEELFSEWTFLNNEPCGVKE